MTTIFENKPQEQLDKIKQKLESNDKTQIKEGSKELISLMASGQDVSSLFNSMLRNIHTNDIELKRLIYIYIVKYSNIQKDDIIMGVSAIIKDSNDPNPLIRAMAIRTMSRIPNEGFIENILPVVKKMASDANAYVRKSVPLAICKLYKVIPEFFVDYGLFDVLNHLLFDDNPLVIANTAVALLEIHGKDPSKRVFDYESVKNILNAIGSSNEWCMASLLDSLSSYIPSDPEEARDIIDRVVPCLKHVNPSVAISAFRCVVSAFEFDERRYKDTFPVFLTPVISLLTSSTPEIQYIILRSLVLFAQKFPKLFVKEYALFFCKYNDPLFIKIEKISILKMIASSENVSKIIFELSEYCKDIDTELVKKSIDIIGYLASVFEKETQNSVDILVSLIQSKASYAIEGSIIVLCDIFRNFPGRFEGIIGVVLSNIHMIKSIKAKSCVLWIIGEYCEHIENVDILLDSFIDSFIDESQAVQLQILTSLVKVYSKFPDLVKDQLQYVLNESNKDNVSPDLRNRALFYWRLLSKENLLLSSFMFFEKSFPKKVETNHNVLKLIRNIGTVSGILHILPTDIEKPLISNVLIKPLKSYEGVEIFGGISKQYICFKIKNNSQTAQENPTILSNNNDNGIVISSIASFPQCIPSATESSIFLPYIFSFKTDNEFEHSISFRYSSENASFDFVMTLDLLSLINRTQLTRREFLAQWSEERVKLQFDLANAMLADNNELEKRNVEVIARSYSETCLAFNIRDSLVLCDVQVFNDHISIYAKGSPVYLKLFKILARDLICMRF